jgi:peroxin-5
VVQRNMTDASAWFDLGVKQQANEREKQALQALSRAVELDPSYLPAWLALAISHTNDGNRAATHDAIQNWVNKNERYRDAVGQYRASHPRNPDAPLSEQFTNLIECLITMARSDTTGTVDADIQIALAVLLNTNEVGHLIFCVLHAFIWITGLREGAGLFPDSSGRPT